MWRTESESVTIDGVYTTVERSGLRWQWRARVSLGATELEAAGFAGDQDVARADAERFARGLAELVK